MVKCFKLFFFFWFHGQLVQYLGLPTNAFILFTYYKKLYNYRDAFVLEISEMNYCKQEERGN
jgi:hypothetical protein